MAGRLRQVTELYETELQRITAERAEWMGFLRFAAALYQYSFDQQLLLYAQRPGATVVLPMEDWNLRYGRWVARGAKAIAVFDENYSSRRQLRFLFDIADTVETNQTRPIPRFEVLPDERPGIIDALVICNEEGKIMGLPYNRCVYDADGIPYDVIAGTFVLCDENRDGEFVSITPEHEAKYMERYSREMILSHAEPTIDVTER